jgi:hypothetical protein
MSKRRAVLNKKTKQENQKQNQRQKQKKQKAFLMGDILPWPLARATLPQPLASHGFSTPAPCLTQLLSFSFFCCPPHTKKFEPAEPSTERVLQ